MSGSFCNIEPRSVNAFAVARDREVASALLGEALALFEDDSEGARHRIETVCTLVRAEVADERPTTCRLADWQMKRVTEFIRANLDAGLRIQKVASLISLSASYFSRAFKATSGSSYSEFVAETRVERAKCLLVTTDLAVSDIALICGLADQSHLTRLFSRAVGLPPSAWRRQVAAKFKSVEAPAFS